MQTNRDRDYFESQAIILMSEIEAYLTKLDRLERYRLAKENDGQI
jgi:hypothetical protein